MLSQSLHWHLHIAFVLLITVRVDSFILRGKWLWIAAPEFKHIPDLARRPAGSLSEPWMV